MPTIGGVFVPDNLMPRIGPSEAERPTLGAILGAATESTAGQLRYGLPLAFKTATETVQQNDAEFYKAGLDAAATAGARAAPAQVSDLTSGRVGFGRFVAENLAGSLPSMAGSLVGAAAGGLAGGPGGAIAGGIAGGVPQFTGSNVARAVENEGTLTRDAALRSVATAVPQAAADALVQRFLPGAGKIFGDFAATQTGGFLSRTAKAMAKAGATEAVTEAGQQLGERFAAGLPVTGTEAAAEYMNAAVTAFAVGGALGAGGGFRRTDAHRKPAALVTEDDLNNAVDQMLALPAPADMIGRPDGTTAINPSGTTQLALPSPEQFRGPDALTDTTGTTAMNPDADRQLTINRNLPVPTFKPSDELSALLQSVTGPQVPAQTGTVLDMPQAAPREPLGQVSQTALATALQGGTRPGDPNVTVPDTRLFADQPLADLNTALRAKGASAEIKAEAEREIAARRAEAIGDAPLTGDFKARLDELKDGLRGGFVQKLDATDPADLVSKVYTEIFENQNTAANVQKLAQRVGILDADLNPTPRATAIETERAAAAQAEAAPAAPAAPRTAIETGPVDPTFSERWQQLKGEAGIKRGSKEGLQMLGNPGNLEQAQQAVFSALAADASNAQISQVEKLARKMGLVTDDDAMDVTELGRQTFLKSGEGLEETVAAAQQQGFTGAQASVFERGARAAVDGVQVAPTFTDFTEMAAYEAGKVWAQDYTTNPGVKTGAQTAAIQARQAARTTGTAVDRTTVDRAPLSPMQVQQQSLNRLLDAVDLATVKDSDVATLRRMVRDGATAEEVSAAVQQVQGGKTLFKEAPRSDVEMVGERPTRGGQPRFKELRSDPTVARAAGVLDSKGAMRAETELAVEAYDLRQQINEARAADRITEARAKKLNDMLDAGQVEQVSKIVKPKTSELFGDRRVGADRRKTDRGVAQTDPALEAAIDGKSFDEVLEHLINEAPSTYHREIMRGVKGLAEKLGRTGAKFNFRLVRPGDEVPAAVLRDGVKAIAQTTRLPAETTIYVKNSDMGFDGGVSYEILAHEMVHAVTQMATDSYYGRAPAAGDKLGQAVLDLSRLANQIIDHFNAQVSADVSRPADARRFNRPVMTTLEKQFHEMRSNAFANVDEVLAWGLTNPDMQRYLATIQYKPKQSVFGRLVELVRKLLQVGDKGIEVRHDSALAELLRVSEQIFGASQRDLTLMMMRNRGDALGTGVLTASMENAAAARETRTRTAQGANDAMVGLSGMLDNVAENIPIRDLAVKARRIALGWISQNHMDREYGAAMPGLLARSDAKRQHDAIQGRFAGMGDQHYQSYERLLREDGKNAERMVQLMALSTEFKVDPDKAWEDHTHLKDDPNAPALKRLHGDAVKLKNDLSRGNGAGYKLYTELRRHNEMMNYARMAGELHALVALDREFAMGVAGANVNPMDTFMQSGLSTTDEVHGYWRKALYEQINAAQAFVNLKKGEVATGTERDQRGMAQHLSPIEAKIASLHEALAGMARSPYFHLGRFGENFGSASIRKLEDGTVDPKAQARVAKALQDAGFSNVQLSTDNTRPKFSARFETADQANRFKELALELQKQGWLDPDAHILAGPRDLEQNFGIADGLPAYVQRYIESIEQSPTFVPDEGMSSDDIAELAQRKKEAVQLARDTWIEQQPDSAISKVLTARHTVPGFDPDMMRSFAHRSTVGSTSLANVATSAKLGKAYEDMRAQKREALDASNPANADQLNDVFNEVRKRDANRPLDPTADGFDKLRALSHSYFLGFSPAYGMVNMTQLGVTALPELAKQAGYSKSFHAMRRAAPMAFAILNAARKEASALGPKHAADVVLTESVLQSAGLSQKQADFMRNMIATGTIDIGTSARALGQVAKGQGHTGLDTYLKYAGAVGLYTETFSRLVTALAAHDLHGGTAQDSAAYATKVVSNSMFDYQSWNTARQLGKQGFAGPVTPLLTQFMQYSVQITEKLYSEVHDAVSKQRPGETAESAAQRRKASRTFLGGHLAAVTALAGTLGLPFASVFAAAAEGLFGDDDEPFDATAEWRNFLAGIFGKDAAEVIARGVPRAIGIDLSGRTGEQDLLPFSKMLGDKRSWREAIEGTLGRSAGAAPDMLLNVADAGRSMAKGDVLGGMKSLVPVAFKGPIEAYRMTDQGYVDSKGNKLPMSPGAGAILAQLLGFAPAEKAEYSEARGDQQSRRVQLNERANTLRSQIVRALVRGDTESARELVSEAQDFDQANPAFAVIPSLGAAITRRQTTVAQAQALQAPIGVGINDLAGQSLTRYADVGF